MLFRIDVVRLLAGLNNGNLLDSYVKNEFCVSDEWSTRQNTRNQNDSIVLTNLRQNERTNVARHNDIHITVLLSVRVTGYDLQAVFDRAEIATKSPRIARHSTIQL